MSYYFGVAAVFLAGSFACFLPIAIEAAAEYRYRKRLGLLPDHGDDEKHAAQGK